MPGSVRRQLAELLADQPIILLVVLIGVGIGAGMPGMASARLWRVSPDGQGDQPTIQAAITAATAGDVVELTAGVYTGPGNRDLDFLGKAITVRSASGAADCIIDCAGDSWDPPHRGFIFQTAEDASSLLVGLTIVNGQATGSQSPAGSGGAILCRNASPTLRDCIFRGNRATSGGALACEMAAPLVENCTFLNNTAEHGGAVQVYRGNPRLFSCRFEGNSAGSGGGINCQAALPEIRDCRFDRNQASQGGAVACTDQAVPVMMRCQMSGNFACLGGAVSASGSAPELQQCTLVANCGGAGGGVYGNENSRAVVRDCIVAFGLQGRGIACDETSEVRVTCTLVYGNGGGDWLGCLVGREQQDGNIWANPLFVAGERGDFSLQPESPGRQTRPGCGQLGAYGP